ncbi:MAG: hypothetical protein AAFX79_10415 [Planctomycetota bacterium]
MSRARPSRASIIRAIIVVGLSVVLWTFAEARSLTTVSRTVTLRLAAPPGSALDAWVPENDSRTATVTLRMEGSRAALGRMAQRLGEPIELVVGDDLVADVGRNPLVLRDVLRDHAVFARSAVGVLEVTPPSLEVEVDEIEERTLPVEVLVSDVELAVPPAATPSVVRVRGPRSRLAGPGVATITTQVEGGRVGSIRGGGRVELAELPLQIPSQWQSELISIEPTAIDATLTLRDTIESYEIPSVPVLVRLSSSQLEQWAVRIEPADAYLRNVTIRGPSELVAAVREGQLPVAAYLPLEQVELVEGPAEFTARFDDWTRGRGSDLEFLTDDWTVPVVVEPAPRTAPDPEPGA